MNAAARIDELKKRYDENPRRFFAPLANEYRKSGDLEQAIAICEAHLREQPGNMNGHVVYGQALFEAARLDEAKATFETAITLDPENLIALRHLGDIARTSGDAPQAREWYTRVLDADPRNDEIIAFIADLDAQSPAAAPVVEAAPESALPAQPSFAPPALETLSGAATIEIAAQPVRTSRATPIVPFIEDLVPGVPPADSAPAPRQSLGLMDLTIDLGGASETSFDDGIAGFASTASAPIAPPAADVPSTVSSTPSSSVAPLDEFDEFEGLDFGDSSPAEAVTQPMEPPASSSMFGDVELDAGIDAPAADVPANAAAELTADFTTELTTETAAEAASGAPAGTPAESFGEPLAVSPLAETMAEPAGEATTAPIADSPASDAPQPFVTETMAELYLQQGLRDRALDVYRQLVDLNPGDESLRERVRSLQASAAPTLDATPIVPQAPVRRSSGVVVMPGSIREFFATLAMRRAVKRDGTPARGVPILEAPSVGVDADRPAVNPGGTLDHLFGNIAVDGNEERLALAFARIADGVEVSPGIKGKPTQPADTELSLDSVFRETPLPRASIATVVPRQSQTLRFDQFFTPGSDATPTVDPSAPPPPAGDPGSPADLEQFHGWLQGLKKP